MATYWSPPLTADGLSALVPRGPWVYGLTGLGVSYRADPRMLEQVVPRPLEPASDGEVFAYIAEIISTSESAPTFAEEMPDVAQYHEAAFFVKTVYKGAAYAYCPFMYVDTDLSLVRGFIAGFPKKLARIAYTKIHPLIHGTPGKGLRLKGFAARSSYTLFRVSVELEEDIPSSNIPLTSMGPFALPRYIPSLGIGMEEVRELVEFRGEAKIQAWRGRGSIEIIGGYNDVLKPLEPAGSTIDGYYLHLYLRPRELRVLAKLEGW